MVYGLWFMVYGLGFGVWDWGLNLKDLDPVDRGEVEVRGRLGHGGAHLRVRLG